MSFLVSAPSRISLSFTISLARLRLATPPHRTTTAGLVESRAHNHSHPGSIRALSCLSQTSQSRRLTVRCHAVPPASAPGLAKMPDDDASITAALAAQESVVQDLVRGELQHGVLIPLKTSLELSDDYITGRVLITRAPVKAANPAIRYAYHPALAWFETTRPFTQADVRLACCATFYLRKSLRALLTCEGVPSRAIYLPT
jgi:hypothetical protein